MVIFRSPAGLLQVQTFDKDIVPLSPADVDEEFRKV